MIRQKEYCDICELEYGEESPKAEILKDLERPAYPQLTWTYFKKGLQILTDPKGKAHLQKNWLGSVNRQEYCVDHARRYNTLLKAFCKSDSELMDLLDKLQIADDLNWAKKQEKIEDEFKALNKKPKKGSK